MSIPVGLDASRGFIGHSFGGPDFGLESRLSYTKKKVFVETEDVPGANVYRLILQNHPDMPFEVAIDRRRTIQWYLEQDFVPTRMGQEITFKQRRSELYVKQLNQLLADCDSCMQGFSDFFAIDLLQAFKKNLKDKKFDFASECINALYEMSPGIISIKQLYADFLFFRKDPGACDLLLDLSKQDNRNKYFSNLEKALMCDVRSLEILESVGTLYASSLRRINHYCYILSRLGRRAPKVAEDVYRAAINKENPSDPLFYHIYLQSLSNPESKDEALQKLQKHAVRGGQNQTKEKHIHLIAVENFEREGQLEEALEALVSAKKSLPGTFAFLKREILLRMARKENVRDLLGQLLARYVRKKNTRKQEAVALLMHKIYQDVGSASQLVFCYPTRNAERAAIYLRMAISNAQQGSYQDILFCVANLEAIYPRFEGFSEGEKKIIFLLTVLGRLYKRAHPTVAQPQAVLMASRIEDVAFDPLVPLVTARVQDVHVRCDPYEATAFFCMDHPRYVAWYGDVVEEEMILFTRKSAEVTTNESSHEKDKAKQPKVYELLIPSCKELPPEKRLHTDETIQWFLASGYLPRVVDGKMTFMQRTEAFFCHPAVRECERFKYFLEQKQYVLAQYELHKLYLKTHSVEHQGLYAEFLAFLKKNSALSVFEELGTKDPRYLARAFLFTPIDMSLYNELSYSPGPSLKLDLVCLFAYLHLKQAKSKEADNFFNKGNSLMQLAELCFLPEQQRLGQLERLAAMYRSKKSEDEAQYYERKVRLLKGDFNLESELPEGRFLPPISTKTEQALPMHIKRPLEEELPPKVVRKFYRMAIDEHLKSHNYQVAKQLSERAVQLLNRRASLEGPCFLKRDFSISRHHDPDPQLLKKLTDMTKYYESKQKRVKLEAVLRIRAKLGDADALNSLASHLSHGDHERESSQAIFENIFMCVRRECYHNAEGFLRLLDTREHLLTEEQKVIIALVRAIARQATQTHEAERGRKQLY